MVNEALLRGDEYLVFWSIHVIHPKSPKNCNVDDKCGPTSNGVRLRIAREWNMVESAVHKWNVAMSADKRQDLTHRFSSRVCVSGPVSYVLPCQRGDTLDYEPMESLRFYCTLWIEARHLRPRQ